MKKKKATPRARASQRMMAQNHLKGDPDLPVSQKKMSQSRFRGETPLTGEDRPIYRAGGKRQVADRSSVQRAAAAGHPRVRSQGLTTTPPAKSRARKSAAR